MFFDEEMTVDSDELGQYIENVFPGLLMESAPFEVAAWILSTVITAYNDQMADED
jgi:hypothetical protein